MRARRCAAVVAVACALVGAGRTAFAADRLVFRSGGAIEIRSARLVDGTYEVETEGGRARFPASFVARVEADPGAVEPQSSAAKSGDGPEASTARSIDDLLRDASVRYAVPLELVRAVARRESAFDRQALSPKGARGVMQLMPATADDLGVADAFDAEQNIDAGVRLLRRLLEKYDGRVADALAAYNAGEGAVERHRGVPPFGETRRYIRAVVRDFEKARPK